MSNELNTELQAVLKNQIEIKSVGETITRIGEEIRKQEKIVAEASVPDREDLNQRLEDAHAGRITETHTAEDLRAIEGEIERHAEAVKASKPVIDVAKAVISGLRRRAEQERDALKRLTNIREQTWRTFLQSRMEQHGEKFREYAYGLHAEFGHLVALNAMMGDENPLGISQATEYRVPTLRLRCFDDVRDQQHLHSMDQLAAPGTGGALLAAEREHLRHLGVAVD